MADGADVRSIPALRDWLASLIHYREEIAASLSGIQQEIRRSYDWIEEQLTLWQRAVRDCEQDLTQAKAELSSRRLQGVDDREPDTTVQERNVRRAEARLDYAEEKVKTCRKWIAQLPKLIEETYTGSGHRLQTFLDIDLANGAGLLSRRLDSLERYAGLRTDYSTTPRSSVPPPPAPPPPASGST